MRKGLTDLEQGLFLIVISGGAFTCFDLNDPVRDEHYGTYFIKLSNHMRSREYLVKSIISIVPKIIDYLKFKKVLN